MVLTHSKHIWRRPGVQSDEKIWEGRGAAIPSFTSQDNLDTYANGHNIAFMKFR